MLDGMKEWEPFDKNLVLLN